MRNVLRVRDAAAGTGPGAATDHREEVLVTAEREQESRQRAALFQWTIREKR